MEKLLIIDDEQSILDLLKTVFTKEGYTVYVTPSPKKALQWMEKDDINLILADIRLPEMSGMDVLKKVKETKPHLPVVMITAYGTIEQAVEAMKAGALDYVVKPFDIEELKIIVAQGLETQKLKEENIYLKKELQERDSFENMIGKSKAMKEIFKLIEKVAGTDSTVLITGESGTGKEMAARAVHYQSHRRDHHFVSINCGALPENLLESELFGHVKGAFTGAVAHKKGMFEVAEKGTLFLDEIGEMSPWTQVKFTRALQEKKIRRVGGTEEIPVDVRIIAASNQDLKKKIKEGSFREDLFYRLNVVSFEMPPLRKRKEDIPVLVSHFLPKYCQKIGRKMKRMAPEAMNCLEHYPWPGNVRELENMVERVVAIEERETITRESLPEELHSAQERGDTGYILEPGFDLNQTLDDISKKYIKKALELSEGNLKEASSLLGVNYRSIRYMVDKYGLKDSVGNNQKQEEGNGRQ
ncbi:sigma-54-dependent Fis family transcriptional regulator, partial [bacterium]|nr:sigma-54-dependent Fis family transcriptional regulator [bacterium]